jgi:hypothetical protein
MHHELTAIRTRLREERGFTMAAVMGTMLVVMMLSVVAFAAAGGDQAGARRDQDYKRAYSAAEAGINEYLFHLNEDASYWSHCKSVDPPAKLNDPWNGVGTDPRVRRTIPGTDLQYAIELLPQAGYTACDTTNSSSMIDPNTGTIRIRSTGFARNTKRSLVATFRRVGFVDFLYYTNFETLNPVTYTINTGGYPPSSGTVGGYSDIQSWASANCGKPYAGRAGASVSYNVRISSTNVQPVTVSCTEINFVSGDSLDGPLHTNDQLLICGTPSFGRNVNGVKDRIEVVNPSGWRPNSGCSNNNPNFVGDPKFGANRLDPPKVATLKDVVDSAHLFTGRTIIQLNGNTMTVNGTNVTPPSNGVIYVQNGSGACNFYDPTNTEAVQANCGDVEVSGSYSFNLTIAAEHDIKITGNLTQVANSNSMLGLIAQNFIRVGHKVTGLTPNYNSNSDSFSWSCTNSGATAVNRIDAALLAIDHSFMVDNYFCGSSLGTLTVNGAIAQNFRGPVGITGSSGYIKDYNYDPRLKYQQPPHFLDPVQTAWRILRQTEQAPAR